jgi:hypothetical protein
MKLLGVAVVSDSLVKVGEKTVSMTCSKNLDEASAGMSPKPVDHTPLHLSVHSTF